MPLTFSNLHAILHHGADTLIDVRSPAEFAEDHIPGAINLPALSNDQRAAVGTMYVQDSAFKARKMGAALVARNVADHLDGPLARMDGSWQPIVYCWRGGQRSGAFASILQQIGWRAETIAGGYQTYRRLVTQTLYDDPLPHSRLVLLDGNTGTGKTAILERLAKQGVQVIDLEGLANHRGSLLGRRDGGQPAQKGFESALATALSVLDPDQPVVLEAESSKIGEINLPPSLWAAMCDAPRIMISAKLEDRAVFLADAYRDVADDIESVRKRLRLLRRIRGHAVVDRWETLLDGAQAVDLARALMADHYDPSYAKSRSAQSFKLLGDVAAVSLNSDGLDQLTQEIATLVNRAV